mmetsp:Transcript_1479/g.2660  ORF Transcript_1479/g.2660 Transcript_1479/m.2660 type:complete len:98 (+) Transcript_1479:1507-1800(+)
MGAAGGGVVLLTDACCLARQASSRLRFRSAAASVTGSKVMTVFDGNSCHNCEISQQAQETRFLTTRFPQEVGMNDLDAGALSFASTRSTMDDRRALG